MMSELVFRASVACGPQHSLGGKRRLAIANNTSSPTRMRYQPRVNKVTPVNSPMTWYLLYPAKFLRNASSSWAGMKHRLYSESA